MADGPPTLGILLKGKADLSGSLFSAVASLATLLVDSQTNTPTFELLNDVEEPENEALSVEKFLWLHRLNHDVCSGRLICCRYPDQFVQNVSLALLQCVLTDHKKLPDPGQMALPKHFCAAFSMTQT